MAGLAYVPQIVHLIKEHCSAGISRLAFSVWLLASLLIVSHAIAIRAIVFIVLGVIQVSSTLVICIFAKIYENSYCEVHLPRRPTGADVAASGP